MMKEIWREASKTFREEFTWEKVKAEMWYAITDAFKLAFDLVWQPLKAIWRVLSEFLTKDRCSGE